MSYPILLNLRDRRVALIGGGVVAARKAADLLDAGAQITVIAPSIHPDLAAMPIDLRPTAYARGMLAELRPLLVFALTDSPAVNQQVIDEARELGILVSEANFTSMTSLRRGEITIALATDGASPALAAHLREKLETEIGEEYALLARLLGDLRPLVRATVKPESRRRDLWRAILASPALDRLRAGDPAGARAIIDGLVAQAVAESEDT